MGITFYDALKKYTTSDLNMSTNTIGKHIKIVKTVLNEATEYGYNENREFQSKRFKVLREEVDSIYLNDEEIELIANLNLSKNIRLEKVRDLFLVGCYTGQAFADYSHFNKSNYNGKFIKYRRKKGSSEIVLPIKTQLRSLLTKYSHNLPMSFSNQKTNEYLKEIGKLIPILNKQVTHTYTKGGKTVTIEQPKYELICTHTARRSFASNEYLNGTPVLSIMKLTGHKTESSFMKYIRLTNEDHAIMVDKSWSLKERKLKLA
jgi:integrase